MSNSTQTLSAKTALLTGASKRLGAATAKKLHEAGANVIIHYNHSKEDAESLVKKFNMQRANSAHCLQADLNSLNAIQNLADQSLSLYGGLDILINNASTFYPTPFGVGSDSDWNDLFNSNAKAPFFLSQHLSHALRASNGNIINMIDIFASRPLENYSIYSMAKSSLLAQTKALAKELAPKIRVNGIAPGAIMWPENATEEEKQAVLKNIPLERIGSVNDIANAILFLLTADYITGHVLTVDGGSSL